MMIGERHRPSLMAPPFVVDGEISDVYSPPLLSSRSENAATAADFGPYNLQEALAALQRYLPVNEPGLDSDSEFPASESDSPADNFAGDHFRMYEFKVRPCPRGRSHDWTECPYAHPGEKARRRDPRRFHYSGAACPDFRKGSCRRGDGCEFAHGVFECWLHPARYRTQPCKDGISCRRRVCFFAHTAEQLRVLPQQSPRSFTSVDSFDGSPMRQVNCLPFLSSPGSISPPATPLAESPPISPITRSLSRSLGSGSGSVNEMLASLRNLQLNKVNLLPTSRNPHVNGSGLGSPVGSMLRPGFSSLPSTPTAPTRSFFGWDNIQEEEPAMERVESGRGLRAKMFEKLSKENSLGRVDPDPYTQSSSNHDIGWVSGLLT